MNPKEDTTPKTLTPIEIVSALDRFIIGQKAAKRSVAIALRSRWRRLQVPEELRDEITPKNIIMIGPTGVGKTEIARRLAKLAQAPFLKVEASKFTEVGYVGRDVESMIRDLTEIAVKMIQEEEQKKVQVRAKEITEERLLDLLIPSKPSNLPKDASPLEVETNSEPFEPVDLSSTTREKFRRMLREGKLDDREVDLEVSARTKFPVVEIFSGSGMEEMDVNIKDMFGNMFPKKTKRTRVSVREAKEIIKQEEAQKLIDMDKVTRFATERVEGSGIIFIDEIDKIAGRGMTHGPDVSREGVQRDILPIIEGSSVSTKYGIVRTEHILFIAAGAFHISKPSDLIPEIQGRFPIRVELDSLGKKEFVRILTEPQNALVTQYTELMKTEGVTLKFKDEAIVEIAEIAAGVNENAENIGARRLYTILENLLDEISFEAPNLAGKEIVIDAKYVQDKLKGVVQDQDLSRYIL